MTSRRAFLAGGASLMLSTSRSLAADASAPLRIGTSNTFGFAATFGAHGDDVRGPTRFQIIPFSGGSPQIINALNAGELDIGELGEVGPVIAQSGGVVIGAGATVGAHCNIANNVSIGFGSPVIGDRVLIGVGARVLGDIRIGSDVAIGANSVVTRDVPDRAIVVGAPGRIISYDGAFKHVRYPDAETDPDRLAALNRTDHPAETRAI